MESRTIHKLLRSVLEKQNYVSILIALYLSMSKIRRGDKIFSFSTPTLQYGLIDTKGQYTAYTHSSMPQAFRISYDKGALTFESTDYSSDIISLQFNDNLEFVVLRFMILLVVFMQITYSCCSFFLR